MPKNPPRLDSALIARKGEAMPAVTPQPPAEITPLPTAPPKRAEASPMPPVPKGTGGTIAVTVRLDGQRYERLKLYGVRNRQTNQEILVAALDVYLKDA